MPKSTYEVELRGNTKVYRTEFGKSIKTNDAFTKSMQGMAKGTQVIDGPLGGVASRITSLNSIASSGTLAITAFGSALAAAGFAAFSSLKTFDEYQRSQLKTEALIRSTGNAAGLTGQQLRNEADAVALATLASVGEIQQAQNVMQSFRSVTGETFNEAIRLSQDMAEVFGGSARDKALQLGKALEDPVAGLNALKRSGVSFTQAERDMVRAMVEAGDTAKAQGFILDKLRQQIGGSGAAAAGGLAGSVDTMGQRWDELMLALEKTTSGGSAAARGIGLITGALVALKEAINPSLGQLEQKLQELEEKQNNRNRRTGRRRNRERDFTSAIDDTKQKILELKAEQGDVEAINALLAQAEQRIASLNDQAQGASTSRRRGGGSARSDINEQIAQQEAMRDQYKSHLEKIQEAERQHVATQAEIASAAEQEQQTRRDEAAEKEAKREKAQAEKDAQIIQRQQDAYARMYEAALQAEGRDIELENARYERKLADMQRDLELLQERGLLTEELYSQHQSALENAEAEHQARIGEIREEARQKDQEAQDKKNQKTLEGYQLLTSGAGTFLDLLGKKESGYIKQAMNLGGLLFDKKKQDSLKSITADTYAAAMGAYKAMAPIPIVGPALGAAAAGVIAAAGGTAAAKVAGIAHSGMTNIPREGTYFLDGNERIIAPEQNRDLKEFMKTGGANNVQVYVVEDSQKAGQVQQSTGPSGEEVISVFVSDIRRGGEAAVALENTYGMQRKGNF